MSKNNKRVKGVDAELSDMRVTFEKIRTHYAKKNAVWCSIDFEAWEGASDVITEFGYTVLRWQDGTEVSESGHWVIAERNNKRNGQYVPDNRDHYLFGDTLSMNRHVFKDRIKELIASLSQLGPLMLVFHDFSGDIKYLQVLEAPIGKIQYALPETLEQDGIYCIDTRKMFSALEGDKNPKSLQRVCRLLKFFDAERFHNAGNDAEYTMMALKAMASGKPLDEQREERWPTKATQDNIPGSLKGVKRQELPEDDSDWEAQEDVL
ncbi:hypothetical protein FRC02_006672 [Tulasnella sp. 418]|nr:hypothetical protein FRC02_006672 [Tulasnella sp. 418]